MTFDLGNPWLIAIIGGALAGIIAGIILYYLFQRKKRNTRVTPCASFDLKRGGALGILLSEARNKPRQKGGPQWKILPYFSSPCSAS